VVDQTAKPRGAGMEHGWKAEGARVDLSGLERRERFRQAAGLPDHDVAVRHKPILAQEVPREEVCDGSDAGSSDTLSSQILHPLDLGGNHGEDNDYIERDRDVYRVRSNEISVDGDPASECRDIYTSANQRLNRPRPARDIDKL